MKQSNNKKSRDVTAFLYERLSRDDNLEGESYSIGNQKKLLAKVAKEKGYTNLVHFLDDGISGVTMDRPGFVEMICQLEQGKASASLDTLDQIAAGLQLKPEALLRDPDRFQ